MSKTLKSLLDKPLFYLLLIAILGLLIYSNTFHVPFQFDDNTVIIDDPVIKELHLFIEPLKAKDFKSPLEYRTFKNRYICCLTFALNYKLHGLDVTRYLFNVSYELKVNRFLQIYELKVNT